MVVGGLGDRAKEGHVALAGAVWAVASAGDAKGMAEGKGSVTGVSDLEGTVISEVGVNCLGAGP